MQTQVSSVPGVLTSMCLGFFTDITDTQVTYTFFFQWNRNDIEFLSSDSDYCQHVYYTNQPDQLPNGNVDTQAAKNVEIPGADFTTFGVHRIDWLPSSTIYSYAGSNHGASITSTTTVTKNVPTTASEFVLNVWSNGDPIFSKGPPIADAIATVQYVHLYFNSTSFSAASFNSACSRAGHIAQCSV
ncbi:hypothetical protein B0H17DRAFT_1083902 [Mycena rosella]|uniref:Concanavalin A-like lectin/glucanase n=1 Tax=Mycena rosella TaxID=1033263 RepID=A0AAD7D0C8_MYCRO|nr:hypothetical protein B0H17DRAFT_1083902 [Mycena rosella]